MTCQSAIIVNLFMMRIHSQIDYLMAIGGAAMPTGNFGAYHHHYYSNSSEVTQLVPNSPINKIRRYSFDLPMSGYATV